MLMTTDPTAGKPKLFGESTGRMHAGEQAPEVIPAPAPAHAKGQPLEGGKPFRCTCGREYQHEKGLKDHLRSKGTSNPLAAVSASAPEPGPEAAKRKQSYQEPEAKAPDQAQPPPEPSLPVGVPIEGLHPIYKPEIDPEFQGIMPRASVTEDQLLDESIKKKGCDYPIDVWMSDGHYYVIDGHRRLQKCLKYKKQLKITLHEELTNRQDVLIWIYTVGLSRRNLSTDARSLLAGKLYNLVKASHGGARTPAGRSAEASGNSYHLKRPLKTAEKIGAALGVSEKTVRTGAQLAKATEALKQTIDPQIEQKIAYHKAPPRETIVAAAKLVQKDPTKAKALLERLARKAKRPSAPSAASLEGRFKEIQAKVIDTWKYAGINNRARVIRVLEGLLLQLRGEKAKEDRK